MAGPQHGATLTHHQLSSRHTLVSIDTIVRWVDVSTGGSMRPGARSLGRCEAKAWSWYIWRSRSASCLCLLPTSGRCARCHGERQPIVNPLQDFAHHVLRADVNPRRVSRLNTATFDPSRPHPSVMRRSGSPCYDGQLRLASVRNAADFSARHIRVGLQRRGHSAGQL